MVTPRITVLMPVYNAALFLREAIDSILLQTFQDFEFLIIDDGSTDESADIIRSYADPRIRFVLNETNLGISETLNKGIRMATCDLIARMDADDTCNPFRLQKQYNYMQAHPGCALLSTWARVMTEDNRFVRLERYRSQYYYYNLTFECWIYHPTIVFKRQPILDVGGYSLKYSEDYDLFWKVSTKYEIGNLPDPLVNYRLSSTSLNTVLKKAEYDSANEQNVLRNIRYYLGADFPVPKPCLECLRHNFEPIISTLDLAAAVQSLAILNQVTEKILGRDNVNRDEKAIKEAHYFKRAFIITQLATNFPVLKTFDLILRTHEWLVAWHLGMTFMRNKIRRVKSLLFSF
jgi:glycosyltransferase involved in cell wall biosynthesis